MKKTILVPILIAVFVMGIAVSDLVMQGINAVLGSEIATKKDLSQKLDKTETKLKETEKKLEAAIEKFDKLNADANRKENNLKDMLAEVDTNVNAAAVRDIILTTPTGELGAPGRIFLNPDATETLLKPTVDDDPTVSQFKTTLNKKAKTIIDVAKGVLTEKVGELNREVLRVNNELKQRNLDLIGKLRAEEKYKAQIGNLNSELKTTNDKLLQRNDQLIQKLEELDKYKKELDTHKKTIADLDTIKGQLEKTVGVLETKIEDGRLKVSFKGDILFESGEHQLRTEGKSILENVHAILSKNIRQNDIFVAGHTDNVAIRPDALDRYDSNWTLSTYRAIEVVKYLTGKGLPPQSLTAAGYGEFKPIADNATPEGKAKNRRVELFLIPKIIKR